MRRRARPARPTGAQRITVGHLAPGLQTGFCKDTGGGWGQQLTAHRSQLHPVPEGFSDEQAILIEPLACAVHTALRAGIANNDRVLVSGAGSVGLFATLALRQLTDAGEIIVVAKHAHQKELAREFGATEVVAPGEVLRRVRRSTGRLPAQAGVLLAVPPRRRRRRRRRRRQQAVARDRAARHPRRWPRRPLRDARRRRPVGRVVPRARGRRHLRVGPGRGVLPDRDRARATDAVQQLAKNVASYPLHRWREALDHAHSAGRLGTVKVAFDPRSTSMSRPGFVLEVDDRTPPLIVHEGLGFRLESFPLGTRVVYPPESLPGGPGRRRGDPRTRCCTRTTWTRCRSCCSPA